MSDFRLFPPPESSSKAPVIAPLPAGFKRNTSGGVLITADDVAVSLSLLSGCGSSSVSAERLGEVLKRYQPALTREDIARLLGGAPSLTVRDATNILVDNSLHFFDPLAEAHKALCGGAGALTQAALNRACETLGQAPFTELEFRTLMEACGQGRAEALGVEAVRDVVARERERRQEGAGVGGGPR